MKKLWSVYSLVDSREPTAIRYIGISCGPRARLSGHINEARKGRNYHRARWIRKVLGSGGSVEMTILHAGLEKPDAIALEISLIASHRAAGDRLVNGTAGGDGGAGPTEEVREKMRLAAMDRRHSEETKRKLGDMARGRPCTQEQRTRVSNALRGKAKSPQHVAKVADALRGKPLPSDVRAKMSEARRGRAVRAETSRKRS